MRSKKMKDCLYTAKGLALGKPDMGQDIDDRPRQSAIHHLHLLVESVKFYIRVHPG
jgi:hypothetical protein